MYISDPFDGHAAMAVHGKIGWTEDLLAFSLKSGFILDVSGVVGNEGTRLVGVKDMFKDALDVIFGVPTNGFVLQMKGFGGVMEQGNG